MSIFTKKTNVRGVNLGGWLVLEKWITPSLFENTNAVDESSLHKKRVKGRVTKHLKTFIQEDDFKYLSEKGINAVRIPVGYWLFGDFKPFPKTVEYLDSALDWADKYNIKVIIDLHGAPGSQNGYDHSGRAGEINWHKNPNNINKTLDILEKLSKRYCQNKNLFGIGLLNEPHVDIPIEILKDFYIKGYRRVRKYCDENVAVIISDSFRPIEFSNILQGSEFKNVILDIHFYQCFYEGNREKTIEEVTKNSKKEWVELIKNIQKGIPIICGEWSLGIYPECTSHLSDEGKFEALKKYGKTQLDIFNKTAGWFFWTYKSESQDGWDLKRSLEVGSIKI